MNSIASLAFITFFFFNFAAPLHSQQKNVVTIKGIKFEMNGKPFEYTGVSFFNAL